MVKKSAELNEKINVSDNVVARGRTDMADIYLKEAERRGKQAKEAYINSLNTDGKDRGRALWKEKQNTIFSIILSVFALEAHINKIGFDKLDNDIFNELKLLKLENKWSLFPLLINNRTFDKTSELFKNFRTSIDLRNRLVHYKDFI